MDERTAEDFDRIARLTERAPPLERASRRILAAIPAGARVLDVGCGLGELSAALVRKGCEVVAIEVSPEMVRRARARGVDARVADLLAWEDRRPFDAVVSVHALHHMPLERALARMAAALDPGGSLRVVDLCASDGIADLPRIVAALTRGAIDRVRHPVDPALRRAWRLHGEHDVLTPFSEARARAERALPGCAVKRLGAWRWALAWRPA